MNNELVAGWNSFWGAIPNSGAIGTTLAIIGGAVMAFFLVKWFWQKSRGGGQGGNIMQGFPWWPMSFGLLLTAPNFLIPLVLTVVQVVIRLVSTGIEFVANLF